MAWEHERPELSVGWVDPRVGLGWEWVENLCFSGLGWVMGVKWQMCEKYMLCICNFVSSIDWQIRFVKTCSWCITASSRLSAEKVESV